MEPTKIFSLAKVIDRVSILSFITADVCERLRLPIQQIKPKFFSQKEKTFQLLEFVVRYQSWITFFIVFPSL